MPTDLTGWIEVATLLAIAVAMGWDAIRLRIPNSVCVVILLLMPVWGLLQPAAIEWLNHLAGFGATFVLGFVLWRLRWFGGGDVKLMAAIALWFGIGDLGFYLVVVSLSGAVLALVLLAARPLHALWMRRHTVGSVALPILTKGAPVPYGMAIGFAALLLRRLMFDGA